MKEINYLCSDIDQNSLEIGNEIYYAENSHLTKTVVIGLLNDNRILIKADNKNGYRDIEANRCLSIDHSVTSFDTDKEEL